MKKTRKRPHTLNLYKYAKHEYISSKNYHPGDKTKKHFDHKPYAGTGGNN